MVTGCDVTHKPSSILGHGNQILSHSPAQFCRYYGHSYRQDGISITTEIHMWTYR